MKFENIAKVGDYIRAYDFKPMFGRNDCYVEGKVEEINPREVPYAAFKILCVTDVFDGKKKTGVRSSRITKTVYVPMEVSFMEYDARIINLSR
jgi:hypothetical protein